MKKLAVLCLFIFIALALFFLKENFNVKMKGDQKPADVTLTWDYSPKSITLETPVDFSFTLKDKDQKNIESAKIDIEATMNHGGMIPIFTEANHIKDGVYKTRFKLTMLGEWIIFLTITMPDGSVAKKEVILQTK